MRPMNGSRKTRDGWLPGLAILLALAALILPPWRQWASTAVPQATELCDLMHIYSSPADGAFAASEPASACVRQPSSAALKRDQQDVLSGIPGGDIPPLRCIADPYPEFSGIAVDPVNNEVLFSDQNRKSLLIYDRAAGNRSPHVTEPLRRVLGPQTGLGFIAGVAIDPVKREFYAVNNDVENKIVVFSRDAMGNALPLRVLYTPNLAWGISLDQEHDELAITSQELSAIFVYRKEAKGLEAPLRVINGPDTGMADPHGIFIDGLHDEIIVANHGSWRDEYPYYPYAERLMPLLPSRGRYQAPSLTVYSRTARGNQAPLRTIQGPSTQLNWPMGIHVDLVNNEIAVANNGDNSILIFRRTDGGDARPVRVIRGTRTNLDHPMGVFIDQKNGELWVANFGNHSATVYARMADGNVAPKRIIRNAPLGTPTVGFGNPMALAYDPARQEILVPN